MVKGKNIREKGKIKFSNYFQKFEKGDRVSIVRDLAVAANFPKTLQGNTGVIQGKQGRSYLVQIKNKQYLVEPVHLKKIK